MRNVELTTKQQVGLYSATICHVRGLAICLVVIRLGNGRAPVDDEVATALVGHARSAQVQLARRSAGTQLQHHFRKIRLIHKQTRFGQTLGIQIHRQIILIDDALQRLGLGIRFQIHAIAQVKLELVEQVLALAQRLKRIGAQAGGSFFRNARQLLVRIGQSLLLFLKNGVLLHNAAFLLSKNETKYFTGKRTLNQRAAHFAQT